MDEIMRSVMAVARRRLGAGAAGALDDPDADLSALGFDSLKIVELIVDLEASLSIEFPADLIDAETFRTVRSVADAVRGLRGS